MWLSQWWVPNSPLGLHQVERVAGTPRHDKSARSLLYLPSWSLVFMPYTPLSPSSLELLQVPALAAGAFLCNRCASSSVIQSTPVAMFCNGFALFLTTATGGRSSERAKPRRYGRGA